MMTRGEKTQLIAGAIAFVPYLFIAWGGAKVFDVTFIKALTWLIGIRLLFSLVETVGGFLAWRTYGRRKAIDGFLHVLRTNSFPKRAWRYDGFLDYLSGIKDDESARPELRCCARELQTLLGAYENIGILPGTRMHSASEAALELYSPKAEAPEYVAEQD